jgi:hypothetical protein
MRSVHKQVSNAVIASLTGVALAGGCSAALVSAVQPTGGLTSPAVPSSGQTQPAQPSDGGTAPAAQPERNRAGPSELGRGQGGFDLLEPKKAKKDEKSRKLPSGESTATSFWDPETASGRPMAYRTLASPYWPLGTKVKITYEGKTTVGVVDDFGPAEWAVAQHNPPAVVDLSEKMMEKLTGRSSNVVKVKFEVIEMGDGRKYRDAGTGYESAMGIRR